MFCCYVSFFILYRTIHAPQSLSACLEVHPLCSYYYYYQKNVSIISFNYITFHLSSKIHIANSGNTQQLYHIFMTLVEGNLLSL